MRISAIALIALAACADVEDDPRYETLSQACDDGDAQACGQVLMLEQQIESANRQARQNMAQALQGMSTPPRQQPMMRTTNCRQFGSSINCTHF